MRDELSDCIVELLFHFDAWEEQFPDGRYLQYDLKLAEEETYHITKENLYDFVPSRRIIHQNMRHRAYRLPVLND